MYPYSKCTTDLDVSMNLLEQQNKIMTTFMKEVVRTGMHAAVLSRHSSMIVHTLIEAKLLGLQEYKEQAAHKVDTTVDSYWRKYGHFSWKRNLWSQCDGEQSTFVFPVER